VLLVQAASLQFASSAETKADAGSLILHSNGFWRVHQTLRNPVVGTPQDATPLPPDKRTGLLFRSQLPPDNWMKPQFDAGKWWRARGPFFAGHGFIGPNGPKSLALLCLRGSFTVADPAVIKDGDLRLSVTYRGGVTAYLNGKEVARKHLPLGRISSETLADCYPLEAYSTPDGVLINKHVARKNSERLAKRQRRLNVGLPADLLKAGRNVLALEFHRAPTLKKSLELKVVRWSGHWCHVGCSRVELRSAAQGVSPRVSRPKGLQVWTVSPALLVYDTDYGEQGERTSTVELVGTRNGAFSGQVVVSSDAPIKSIRAEAGELRRVGGSGVIPASAVQVRYALPDGPPSRHHRGVSDVRPFDGLEEGPPSRVPLREKRLSRRYVGPPVVPGAVQPVWVTVHVPADAAPGTYRGTLTVRADATVANVLVSISVADWELPRPEDFVTFVDLIQSPETVAMKYKVPLWSDKHFDLIGKSYDILGTIGNDTIYLPLICKTHFGNGESLVRWVRGADGGYTHDFSIFDRYLDVAVKHMGRPQIVVLYVSERYVCMDEKTGHTRNARDPLGWYATVVTVVDRATAKVGELKAPKYTTPAMKAFWKPVIAGVLDRLSKRGLGKTAVFGLPNDFHRPGKSVTDLFKELAPGVLWASQAHGAHTRINDVPTGYVTTVWNAKFAQDPSVKRTYGWKYKRLVVEFPRDLWRADLGTQMLQARLRVEANIQGKQYGVGRLGGDFWPVLKGPRGLRRLIGRHANLSTAGQLTIKTTFLAPGRNGAISTVRLEMMREGIQECEARIFIEKALLDAGMRAKLGEGLASKCQALLDERTRSAMYCSGKRPDAGYGWFVSSGWQERSAKLFAAAAKVAQDLGR